MATEAANAERQARAQNKIDANVDRIARALNFAAPPRTRQDHAKEVRGANEAERMATFLELVANHVDPANAGKSAGETPALGGIGEYSELDAKQRDEAERQRNEEIQTQGVTDEGREERQRSVAQPGQKAEAAGAADEPEFRGHKLSEFDAIPDDQIAGSKEGIGEATAAEIVKARRKRDRQSQK